ncbi:MAG: DNA polymerase III subunit delta [Gammaproteobacteria bacterium]|nr:DNA polymerase III subunit delta [Gammaproteobacteria bacterium]
MQIKSNQLQRHLDAGRFAPVYLVSGDEPLLVEEACASIVAAAEANGFSDRKRFDLAVDGSLEEALAGAANLSLFASKRMLDIRLPAKGLDRKGSDTIRRYLGSPPPSTMLLCRAVGLDWRTKSSAWHRAVDKAGAVVQVWPVGARELPRWLDQRCRASGLQLDREAISILAERVEGNLLAAAQEIEKLRLSGRKGTIGADEMRDAVGDSAHFDTFQMIDTAFAGQGARACRMARVLRQDGIPIFMVMGALVNQLRRAREVAAGGSPRMPRNRAQQVKRAVQRLGADRIDALLRAAAVLDLQSKGMLRGDAWQSLERMVVAIAGGDSDGLEERADYLRAEP